MTAPSTLAEGQVLGHYTILGPIGKGGMGEVYRARDNRLDRVVALKLLPKTVVEDRERLQRFQKEARTLAALNHPGIVTLHAVEEEEGHHFLIMEFVEGGTLRPLIPEDGLPLDRFFELAVPLSEALAAAHEQGIIHRDLKPENLMLTRSGRLKVLDFGLARTEPQASGSDQATQALTQQGFIVGTIPYLSPEQAQGRTVDARSDIFSLGILLHELLTGHRPFRGQSSLELISSILRDAPEPAEEVRGDLPSALGPLLRRCLAKEPGERFQSMQEVHEALMALRQEMDAARILSGSRPMAVPARLASLTRLLARSRSRMALHGLLALVMGVNLVETLAEGWLRDRFGLGVALGDRLAQASSALERGLSFELHDLTNPVAIYGYSVIYFFIFPLMAVGTAWGLIRRSEGAYRTLVHAVVLAYAISLPFFLFFPVPERWFYPESGAVLLSDLWTSRLIEWFRPMSGIDNCFPSFHTSLSTILVAAGFHQRLRHRHALAGLGAAVLLSTFVLGIHWITDIVAGVATGLLAYALAVRTSRVPPPIPSHARTTLGRAMETVATEWLPASRSGSGRARP